MSLLSRIQLAAAALCSTDVSRHALTHLHVTGKTVEACDGHVLVRVTRTDDPKEDDFPNILPDTESPAEAFIPAAIAATVAKTIPKRMSHLPIVQNAQLRQKPTVVRDEGPDTITTLGDVVIGTTDLLDTPQIITLRPMDSTFPNIDNVLPKKEDGAFSIGFDAHLLIRMCQYATKFNTGRAAMVELTFYDSNKPVRMDWKDEAHTAIGVIMPMRLDRPIPMPMPKARTKKLPPGDAVPATPSKDKPA